MAFADLCPAVTLECGRPGEIGGEQHALDYLETCLHHLWHSNGDGIGDFEGLAQKLDYLQDLGVTAIWLLPFYPSPLKDDGYDISDYTDVHSSYGTLHDFREFLREAHNRGLRVITELIVNHTSDQHPWFQRARRTKAGSRWRNFYVWSDTPAEKYKDARIIFKDSNPLIGAGTPSPKPITGTASTPINPTSTTITPKSGVLSGDGDR